MIDEVAVFPDAAYRRPGEGLKLTRYPRRQNLIKEATGTLTLAADNTYLGTTTITGGVLQVATARRRVLGRRRNHRQRDARLQPLGDFEVTNVISGTGDVIQAGSGTLEPSGANTYAGATEIQSGSSCGRPAPRVGLPATGTTRHVVRAGGTLTLSAA